jgi:acyl carrier protein
VLGSALAADRFSAAVRQLREIEIEQTVERRQALLFMVGNLSFWSILIALNHQSNSGTVGWLIHRLDKCLFEFLSQQVWVWSETDRQSIMRFSASNETFLQDIDQHLPGEDLCQDPMLRTAIPDFQSASPEILPRFDSTSGKADVEIARTPSGSEHVNAKNQLEQRRSDTVALVAVLSDWFAQNLRVAKVGNAAELTFAELGLDSFHAALLSADMSQHVGVEIDVTTLWRFPTLGEYADYLVTLAGEYMAKTDSIDSVDFISTIDAMSEDEAEKKLAALLEE